VARAHGRGHCAAGPAADALTPGYSVPGKEGWETNEAITARYGDTGADTAPLVPVVTLPKGTTVDAAGVRAVLAIIDDRLHKALPGSRIASFTSTGDRTFVSDNGRTVFALAYPPTDPNSLWARRPRPRTQQLAR
jgi:RND superfamily putative drug exporter